MRFLVPFRVPRSEFHTFSDNQQSQRKIGWNTWKYLGNLGRERGGRKVEGERGRAAQGKVRSEDVFNGEVEVGRR